MITLVSTLLSFLAGGLPKLLGFFQDRSDKAHELDMAKMQMERYLKMAEAGYLAQARGRDQDRPSIHGDPGQRAGCYVPARCRPSQRR